MITSELFNKNENLRGRLAAAMDTLEVAFMAIGNSTEIRATPPDQFSYALAHAEHQAVEKFKQRLRDLANVPREEMGPLETNYAGIDPFDQIRIDAEQEHAQTHAAAQASAANAAPPALTPSTVKSTPKTNLKKKR